ncbi:hypothetical protein CPB83DRAFT_858626 [Crepidotus variabilis]|uniref:CUE domain-containing protein n=1 Tax=Crepidotus variabilis TaxID=179855 RepID=A0A9P6EB19_9AGAR|nr:hypothetical protein CPB83DRAFT_858626 [Crepidotus variabilis]
MSQYKSAPRAQHQQQSSDAPYRAGAHQLQELFPSWPNDDLVQLLTDLNGDVTLAATKISDGAVQPWGEVSRKKDKKPTPSAQTSKASTSGRGDFRGARGGRGGRGGPGRGGAVTRGRGGPAKVAGANGHAHLSESSSANEAVFSTPADSTKPVAQDASPKPSSLDSHDLPDGNNVTLNDSSNQAESTSTPAPGVASVRINAAEIVNGSAAASASSKHLTKSPATSKLSWAQIARPLEKSAPPTTPQTQAPASTNVTPAPSQPPAPSSTTPEPSLEPQQNGWEEPTTVEPPSWDDSTQNKTADDWLPTSTAEPVAEPLQTEVASIPSSESEPEPSVEANPPPPVPEAVLEEPKPLPAAVVAAQSALPAQVTATPSPKLSSRPAVTSHRSSTRHKIPDQPVTLPISFGTGIEKVGMQFGSLSLGDAPPEPQNESQAPVAAAPEPTPAPVVPQPKPQVEAPALAPPPATAPPASTSLSSVFQHQQQQLPAPQHPVPTQALHTTQPSVPHHLPTSISQPLPTNQSNSLATASPLQQFAQQHQVVPNQQSPLISASTQQQSQHHQTHHLQQTHTPHLPQQLQQNQALHNYAQHGLPSQLETSQQTQPSTQQQSVQNATHSNYFRGSEPSNNSPYFQTSTPPVTQSQDTSYGSFGQGSQSQHLQQGSHLGGFNNNEYSYTDNARGFYDSYTQQPSFASRNQLGHDDVKGLTSASQQPSAASLPPSSTQGPQSHSSQAANQPQPNTPQGPQQYPPPVPYYYTHAYPQNQYYGSPYSSGYVPQPFVKYPTMFQPGPPGPASAGNPSSKQPTNIGVGVQPQTNPYNQSLYQQGGYDDYQNHPHHSQHQHNHSLGLGQGGIGVNSADYGKPLYGSSGQTGMQGFMGLGGQTGTSSSGPSSNAGPRSSTSPEAAYKPYASKDVGVSGGRGAPVPQGQGQVPQSQNQGPTGQTGPQGQGFYSGNRFSGNVAAAGAGGAAQQPQGHLGYPQGVNDNFYGYQPRQQQGYWQ